MSKSPTVYDVAARAGVSTATVSRVLRRSADVSAAMRERVVAAVRDLGYVPSASARGLAARKTGVLGLYFPGFDAVEEIDDTIEKTAAGVEVVDDRGSFGEVRPPNLYFDEVLRGSELEARRGGFALMVGVSGGMSPEEMVSDLAGRVDGLAVLAQSVPLDLLEHVSRRIPVVLIAGPRRDDDFDHVSVSNTEGMRALTEHLIITHGADAPVYLAGPADSPDDSERYQGFVQALEAHGIDPGVSPILRAGFSRVRARGVAEHLVRSGNIPRVLVCGNDQMALGVLDVFEQHGIRVPGDVIVTGFDGIDASRQSSPRLTTVEQPMMELGRMAIRTVLSRVDEPDQDPITVRLPVRVVLRESSEGAVSD